jgi:O-antigen/teichoic acid export membrane protein
MGLLSNEWTTASVDSAAVLSAVPHETRRRIVAGMRWTVWLSLLAAPFSYCTSVLLARAGPEVIGTFGILSVYLAFGTAFLYLGGDTVTIKFIPELAPRDRLSFLLSYFLLIGVAAIPWIIVAAIWSSRLHYLFGPQMSASSQLLLLSLAPIPILLSLVIAALKGNLEIRAAQLTARFVTVGFFICLAVSYFGWRSELKAHSVAVIWSSYLALALLAALAGLARLFRLPNWRSGKNLLRIHFPRGFSRYLFATQQVGLLSFFINRLDYVLVLNFAGLAFLGRYVAVVTLASVITMVGASFLDPMLPSLTNLIADCNFSAASQVFSLQVRILFLVNAAATLGLIMFVGPLTALLGPQYSRLGPALIICALLIGLAVPGSVGVLLLSSVGKQQRAVWVGLAQIALYILLFSILWRKFNLIGAILAEGVSLVAANASLFLAGKFSVPFAISVRRPYAAFASLVIGAAGWQLFRPCHEVVLGLSLWCAAMGLFLLCGGYRLPECVRLVRQFMPLQSVSSVSPNPL